MMARLLARTCCFKALSRTPKCLSGLVAARPWSHGPLTAYMPEAVAFPRPKDHQDLYKASVEQSDIFWGALGRNRLTWITPFHSVQDCDLCQGRISWFLGGQLNVTGKKEMDVGLYQVPAGASMCATSALGTCRKSTELKVCREGDTKRSSWSCSGCSVRL